MPCTHGIGMVPLPKDGDDHKNALAVAYAPVTLRLFMVQRGGGGVMEKVWEEVVYWRCCGIFIFSFWPLHVF